MALGATTFSDIGGAVSDLFQAKAFGYKAQGAEFEKKNYLLASDLAEQNKQFTQESTAIQQMQQERASYQAIGRTQADIAGAGFAASGSALDILRDSTSQAALTNAVIGQQGLITEAGYEEQAQSYKNMASAADVAIQAAKTAQEGSYITAGIKGVAAIASLFTGGGGAPTTAPTGK